MVLCNNSNSNNNNSNNNKNKKNMYMYMENLKFHLNVKLRPMLYFVDKNQLTGCVIVDKKMELASVGFVFHCYALFFHGRFFRNNLFCIKIILKLYYLSKLYYYYYLQDRTDLANGVAKQLLSLWLRDKLSENYLVLMLFIDWMSEVGSLASCSTKVSHKNSTYSTNAKLLEVRNKFRYFHKLIN